MKGPRKWQGETLDWVWYDESRRPTHLHRGPDAHERDGRHGVDDHAAGSMSGVVRRFLMEDSPDRAVATDDDR